MISPIVDSSILLGLAGGLFLGVIFFGGLRLTLNLASRMRNPVLLVLLSYLLRLGVLFLGLAALGIHGGVAALLAATAGLTIILFTGTALFGKVS